MGVHGGNMTVPWQCNGTAIKGHGAAMNAHGSTTTIPWRRQKMCIVVAISAIVPFTYSSSHCLRSCRRLQNPRLPKEIVPACFEHVLAYEVAFLERRTL